MSGLLQFNSQKWKLVRSDGLKLFLPRQHKDRSVYYQTEWFFVAPEAEALPADAPKMRLRLIGYVPGLRDWRDLENLYLGFNGEFEDEEAEPTRGPDLFLWQPGETLPLKYGHWETDLKFGERRGQEFEFSMEALCRSERASKFQMEQGLKEFFQQPLAPDWEVPEWIDEGDRISFEGRVEFREIFCSVPINSAQPVELARQWSRRELAQEQFGRCRLDEKPDEGIANTGRLVVVELPAAKS
jgi:hypothetical protein